MKTSIDQMAYRLLDTSNFLETFVDRDNKRLKIDSEHFEDFLVRSALCIICNQSALMTYFLEKENYPGLPGKVEVKKLSPEEVPEEEA